MKANDPFRKNVRFGNGVFFTVLEGLLSACVYMAIYLLLNMLLNNTVTIEHLNNLTFLIIGDFFYRPADYLRIWDIHKGKLEAELYPGKFVSMLGDKFKRNSIVTLSSRPEWAVCQHNDNDVSNYEQILTHRTGNLVKNISLSVMLILFRVCSLFACWC